VEALARKGLGARVTAVRTFQAPLEQTPNLAAAVPHGERLDVLLAAQVVPHL
jgi:hypothetical protein